MVQVDLEGCDVDLVFELLENVKKDLAKVREICQENNGLKADLEVDISSDM